MKNPKGISSFALLLLFITVVNAHAQLAGNNIPGDFGVKSGSQAPPGIYAGYLLYNYDTSKHPQTGRLYTGMVYQPMLELLAYLRSNGFKTFIVSGGGVEFMRAWSEEIYGILPEQVLGSSGKLHFESRDGKPVLIKLPTLDFVDDKDDKPVAIQGRIGRRPIAAFGNSDGGLQMLQWTMAGNGARFALFVHHDDAAREYAFDRTNKIQQFNKGWDEAVAKGWTVVRMKNDWKIVYPQRSNRKFADLSKVVHDFDETLSIRTVLSSGQTL